MFSQIVVCQRGEFNSTRERQAGRLLPGYVNECGWWYGLKNEGAHQAVCSVIVCAVGVGRPCPLYEAEGRFTTGPSGSEPVQARKFERECTLSRAPPARSKKIMSITRHT